MNEERVIVDLLREYGLDTQITVTDRKATDNAKATVRMHTRAAVNPYEELCEAANAFVSAGDFYLPGSESATRLLDRFRRAASDYQNQKRKEERG